MLLAMCYNELRKRPVRMAIYTWVMALLLPMSLKPPENRRLTAVNRPVNREFNRAGNRGSPAKFFRV